MKLQPDISILQEVNGIPEFVTSAFAARTAQSQKKTGGLQSFSTAILVKGAILSTVALASTIDWVGSELLRYSGNLLTCDVSLEDGTKLRITSVYSPAWPVDKKRIAEYDVSDVKLTQNKDVWVADLFCVCAKYMLTQVSFPWIVAGDFNLSETFDSWPGGPRGNLEYLQRMEKLGLTECLRSWNAKLTPTYLNKDQKGLVHQMDHMFVTSQLSSRLLRSTVGSQEEVVDGALSDHLPIISDFASWIS